MNLAHAYVALPCCCSSSQRTIHTISRSWQHIMLARSQYLPSITPGLPHQDAAAMCKKHPWLQSSLRPKVCTPMWLISLPEPTVSAAADGAGCAHACRPGASCVLNALHACDCAAAESIQPIPHLSPQIISHHHCYVFTARGRSHTQTRTRHNTQHRSQM
jgi:hypothetical protein